MRSSDNFTERAKKAINEAQEAANRLGPQQWEASTCFWE
jgi:hypothetical protein